MSENNYDNCFIENILNSLNNNDESENKEINNINSFIQNLENELTNNNSKNEVLINNTISNNDNYYNIIKNNKDIVINSLLFILITCLFINKTNKIYILIKTIIFIISLYFIKKYL